MAGFLHRRFWLLVIASFAHFPADGFAPQRPIRASCSTARAVASAAPAEQSYTIGAANENAAIKNAARLFVVGFYNPPGVEETPESNLKALASATNTDMADRYSDRGVAPQLRSTLLVAAEDNGEPLGVCGLEVCLQTPTQEGPGALVGGQDAARILEIIEEKELLAETMAEQFNRVESDPTPEPVRRPVMANLAVLPAARRRGVARALCAKTEALVEEWGFDELLLLVDELNGPARTLYEKLGYELTGDTFDGSVMRPGAGSIEETSRIKTINVVMRKQLRAPSPGPEALAQRVSAETTVDALSMAVAEMEAEMAAAIAKAKGTGAGASASASVPSESGPAVSAAATSTPAPALKPKSTVAASQAGNPPKPKRKPAKPTISARPPEVVVDESADFMGGLMDTFGGLFGKK